MDPLLLSRWQFAVTTCYHFLFVPLSIGLGLLVAIMETLYLKKKDEQYLRMTKFWGQFFLISVAMGIVTGIVLEFQFGLNWARFSRYVGDIFGPPLAIESWVAFFLESVFIGVWLYGGKKLPLKLHVFSIWMVTLGAALSAFWIISANGFMQKPAGYVIRNGRIELVDFPAVVFNSQAHFMFWHTVSACLVTSAFFVIGVCAYHLLKKTAEQEFFKRSLRLAVVMGLTAMIAVIVLGHFMARSLVDHQPMKLAAAEAIWETRTNGNESLFAIIDEKGKTNRVDITVPWLLNVLVYDRLSGAVRGLNDIQKEYVTQYGPGDYIPPVTLTYWSFRLMIFSGLTMLFLLLVLAVLTARRARPVPSILLKVLLFTVALPHVANLTGWIVSEVGRQPWVVQGLLLTRDGLTQSLDPVIALSSLILFTLIYSVLAFIATSLIIRHIKSGPAGLEKITH
ncbi:MAG: cytochrome ubiquinol oxidase subunit I [Candidatus Omnitrophica bacterium]|nr:cytochrome ubiquinol oxidase subunit I [Candidatus Omnitrophota bacterium]